MNAKVVAIISIAVIAALFGLYSIAAKTSTSTTTGPASTTTGGVGQTILTGLCAALGIKC